MAEEIVKIYELRSLGYDQLAAELDSVNKAFAEIKKTKQDLNRMKAPVEDPAQLEEIKNKLAAVKAEEIALRIEKTKLTNEAKAAAIVRQQEINQAKAQVDANNAEAGSYAALLKAQRELYAIVKLRNANSGSTIDFRGEILTFDQAIAKLKQLSAAEQDFRRQFAKDGLLVAEYTSGIVQAFKSMGLEDLIGGQVTKATQKLDLLNKEFNELQQELSETKVTGQGSLEVIERQMIENRKETIALTNQIGTLQKELRGAGDVGNQISTSINEGFKSAKAQLGQFVLQYIGFQAALSGVQLGIGNAKELSDQTTDLEIQLNKAAGGADNLIDSLSKLDTRTTLIGLEQIADVALKAGTTAENLEGVARAVDITKVAFGKDFGDIESGTETFAKLINIFFDDREITGDRILKIGNSIRTLANETVASVPFINDFAGRMAGLRQVSRITLPDVIGLGAGFEEFKQSAEVSSTALVKIIPKLASDVEKYASITGLTIDQFRKLIDENPAEALITVSEALVKGKGNIEEVSEALADAELGAGRATTIIATLGGKADVFRDRIKRAGESMNDTNAITDAFNAKNDNLAGTLDKISKKFADAANSKAFQITLSAISAVIILLLNNLPLLIGLASALAISWGVQNAALLVLRVQMIGYNLLIARNYIAIGLLTVANGIYTAGLYLLNGAYALVTRAAAFFNITLSSTPIGLILTGLALLATAFSAYGKSVSAATLKMTDQIRQANLMKELMQEAQKAMVETVAKEKLYTSIISDTSLSLNTRNKALKDLIALSPDHLKGLTLENVAMAEGRAILESYNKELLKKSLIEANAARSSREFQKLVSLQTIQQDVEFAIKSGKGFNVGELPDDIKDKLAQKSNLPLLNSLFLKGAGAVDLDIFSVDKLRDLSKVLSSEIQNQNQLVADVVKNGDEITKQQEKTGKAAAATAATTTKSVEIDIQKLKDTIKGLDAQIESFKGSRRDLSKVISDRDKAQKQLDALLNKNQGTGRVREPRASRLTADQKDDFKDIDAIRDKAIAEEKLNFEQRITTEETFLQNTLEINRKALEEKLKLLKGSNAEERKQIAELNLEKVTIQIETNNKLFELHQKQIQEEFEQNKRNADALSISTTNNPVATDLEKAQAKLNTDNALLDAQEKFNADMDALEEKYNIQSTKNAKERADALKKINADLSKDTTDAALANLDDIKRAGDNSIAEFELIIDKAKLAVQANKNLSEAQKANAIRTLENERDYGVLVRQAAQYKNLEAGFRKAYENGIITLEQYEEIVKRLGELQDKMKEANPAGKVEIKSAGEIVQGGRSGKGGLRAVFGIKEGDATDDLLNKAIKETYSLATDVMNNYFDAERQRLEENRDLQYQRLDIEKEQLLARAESRDEELRIDQEYAAKKRSIDREYGEQLKKNRRAEAKISLATELAGIAVSAAQNPLNGLTFGASGAIMYGLLAALAVGRYAVRVSEINREKFAKGKLLRADGVPTRGGEFGGRPHASGGTPFLFQGKHYEAEAKELAVIRTANAPKYKKFTITGNQAEIASALNEIGGGIRFQPGAKITKFAAGGYMGESLQAPIYSPSNNTVVNNISGSGENSRIMDLLTEQAKAVQAVNGRIDRLQVNVNPRDITDAQRKQNKQSQVGTL